ncbi:uncharacterized protein [Miscanthus floridulus]|uniref:uncharacterized protein n=1 Tax=Miscanthus floridulus TaxID=154761 RepID=UPI00345B40DF
MRFIFNKKLACMCATEKKRSFFLRNSTLSTASSSSSSCSSSHSSSSSSPQVETDESLLLHRHDAAHSPINKTTTATNDGPRFHDNLVGKDVILFAILRSELAVARGTVISTNPNTMVGGQPLGNEYCEVVVNVVMRRDAMLPWTYGEMQTMASALKMSIAWPYNKIKECKKKECKKASSTPLKGTAGSVGQSLA